MVRMRVFGCVLRLGNLFSRCFVVFFLESRHVCWTRPRCLVALYNWGVDVDPWFEDSAYCETGLSQSQIAEAGDTVYLI